MTDFSEGKTVKCRYCGEYYHTTEEYHDCTLERCVMCDAYEWLKFKARPGKEWCNIHSTEIYDVEVCEVTDKEKEAYSEEQNRKEDEGNL